MVSVVLSFHLPCESFDVRLYIAFPPHPHPGVVTFVTSLFLPFSLKLGFECSLLYNVRVHFSLEPMSFVSEEYNEDNVSEEKTASEYGIVYLHYVNRTEYRKLPSSEVSYRSATVFCCLRRRLRSIDFVGTVIQRTESKWSRKPWSADTKHCFGRSIYLEGS
jgi:hypothetical protein